MSWLMRLSHSRTSCSACAEVPTFPRNPAMAGFRGKVGTSAQALQEVLECDKRISFSMSWLMRLSHSRTSCSACAEVPTFPRNPAMAGFRGKVGTSAQALQEVLECDKRISQLIEKLYHYASLR